MGENQQMNKRFLVIPLAAAAAAAIALVAANSGADFSGTSSQGTISGTTATVAVLGADGNSMNISFAGPIVPGAWSTTSVTFQNSGNTNEDIFVVFPDKFALHAFNQQGRYAQAYMQVDGNNIWSSGNLNDGEQGSSPAGPYNCSTPGPIPAPPDTPQVCPLDEHLLLSNVGGGDHTFTFGYLLNSSQTNPLYNVGNINPIGGPTQNSPFNPYPVGLNGNIDAATNESGLPYQFYAVQTGGAAPGTDISPSHN